MNPIIPKLVEEVRKLLGKEENMLQDLCQAVKKPIWDLNDILVRGAKVQRAWEAENLVSNRRNSKNM